MSLPALQPQQSDVSAAERFLYFSLPSLLPDDQELIVNPDLCTVTLFRTSGGEEPILQQVRCSEFVMRILIRILQAYPQHCSYQELLACLHQSADTDESDKLMKSLYNTVDRMRQGLAVFGLHLNSTWGQGYLLVATRPCLPPCFDS